MAVCSATKRNGSPCTLPVKGANGYCWAHDPANSEKRRRAAAKGGKGKSSSGAGREMRDIKSKIEKVIEGVLDGTIERGIGAVAFQGLNVLLKAHDTDRKLKEVEEILQRIEALEVRQSFSRVAKRGGRW